MRKQFGEIIDEQVGRIFGEAMTAKSVRHSADKSAGVPRGLHIHLRIPNEHRVSRSGAEFTQNRCDAHRIRLLLLKTVATIYQLEIAPKSADIDNYLAESCQLVT